MKPQLEYFKTTHLTPEQLTLFSNRAKSQTEKVLAIFEQKGPILSPWEVWDLWGYIYPLGKERPLKSSIGRSMTVLTKRKKLRKLPKERGMRISEQGAPEHLWELVKPDEA